MDDLLALMDNDDVVEEVSNNKNACAANTNASTTGGSTPRSSSSSVRPSSSSSSSSHHSTIDPFTKIRIVNRQTSKVEMVDIFASFTFQTTASLIAMSNQNLSTLLLPSNNLNNGISGKTHAATMGIIFSNSKSKISKTGRAFSILKVGDLNTGPNITVFLFGAAYSKFTTLVNPGQVLAFVAMNILPVEQSQGKDTRLSFSVSLEDQIYIVGKAMDYGTCAGTSFVKIQSHHQHHSQSNNAQHKKCKNFVDLRIGKFCQYHIKQQHRQQQHKQSSSGTTKKMNQLNPLQKMKADKLERTSHLKQSMQAKKNGQHIQGQRFNSRDNSNVMTMLMPGQGTVVTHVMKSKMQSSSSSASLKSHNLSSSSRATLTSTLTSQYQNNRNKSKTVTNPYLKNIKHSTYLNKNKPSTSSSSNNNNKKTSSTKDILGEALHSTSIKHHRSSKPTSKSTNDTPTSSSQTKKKRKCVPSYMEGFNGQVPVPKPNKLFNRQPLVSSHTTSSSGQNFNAPVTPSPEQKAMLYEKQKLIAMKLKQRSTDTTSNSKNDNQTHSTNEKFENLFSDHVTMEKNELVSATSKYKNEANAELYARKRNVLCELEKKELLASKKDSKLDKCGGSDKGAMAKNITVEWLCKSCQRTFRIKPTMCMRQKHRVSRKIVVKKKESEEARRMGLKNKSVQDGGLTLGSGLEWSEWRR